MHDLCQHFGECGGCRWQDVPYPEQLARKGEALRKLFGEWWCDAIPVEPSPAIWHYRNKVDFSFGRKFYPEPPPKDFVRESLLGFKAKGRWYRPLEIHECRIGPEGLDPLLASVRRWMHAQGLHAFDSRTRQGFLRALLVREGKRTQQRMVVLITSDGEFDRPSFIEAVLGVYAEERSTKRGNAEASTENSGTTSESSALHPSSFILHPSCSVTSIHRGIFRGLADVAAADETELLYGTEAIDECLEVPGFRLSNEAEHSPLRFRISPFSFFQTNTLAAERLYGGIRKWLSTRCHPKTEFGGATTPFGGATTPFGGGTGAGTTLYDLYGGAGGVALACSDLVRRVYSVESVASASRDGLHNAAANGIENVQFVTDKVEIYLRDQFQLGGLEPGSVVVVDPPRSGMHPKALRRLIDLRPPHLLYVSCKPSVLSRELPGFLEVYRLSDLSAFDLFPHTEHVEVLAALDLR